MGVRRRRRGRRADRFRKLAGLCVAAMLAFPGVRVHADADTGAFAETYLADLIARAQALRLGEQPGWRALGFYYPDWIGGGVSSLVDDKRFFASANGRTEPELELEATIGAFFEPVPQGGPDAHPQCRWPARYRWLNDALGFDPARLPEIRCPAFEAWLAEVDPERVTLIFPAAYLNNPSSMFGHTLLRIDPPGGREETRLIAYAVNFAADHQGEQGVAFAIKGLAGGYRGYFSLLPYYEKVRQYSDIESRDIWEYPLALDPEEVRRMLASLWELDQKAIDYYFFTTNCSFVLLALLNTARPGMALTDDLPFYAVPVDTVRAVLGGAGLAGPAVYRASAMSRVGEFQARLDAQQQRLALALATGALQMDDPRVEDVPAAERALVFELAQSYLQYQLDSGEIGRDVAAPRALALLRARAAMGPVAGPSGGGGDHAATVPPDQGHRSARLAGGFGMTGRHPFAEIRARPVYHDLVDPAGGFVPGAAIELLDVRLRQYGEGWPLLDSLTLFAAESLAPRDEIFRPVSWRMRGAADRFRDDGGDRGELVGQLEGGVGGAWRLSGEALASLGVDAALFAGADGFEKRLAGAGPAASLLSPLGEAGTLRLQARWQGVVGTDGLSDRFRAGAAYGWALGRDLSLRLEGAAVNDGESTYPEWIATLNWYF